MGARGEILKKVTAAEKWSVGVTAHHIAVAHATIGGRLEALAEGKPGPNIPVDATVRGLSDDQMDRSGSVIAGVPAMSAGQLAGGLLCTHIDEHLGSIRATVGA